MSELHKGKLSGALGKHWKLSKETKNKMSLARKKFFSLEEIEANKEKQRENSLKNNRERRIKCLIHYGGNPPKCKCCGESIMAFLSIDHINGGGNKHRKEMGIGRAIYPWLIKNNFPVGFQVLCYNCNMAKGFYGICPHNMK